MFLAFAVYAMEESMQKSEVAKMMDAKCGRQNVDKRA